MTSIFSRMIKDGNRTILIFEGGSREQDEAAYNMLLTYYNLMNPGSDPEKVEGLKPAKEETMAASLPTDGATDAQDYGYVRHLSKTVLHSGTYLGLTPTQALKKGREDALVEMFCMAKKLPQGEEFDGIVSACRTYMMDMTPENDIYLTRPERVKFIETMSKIQKVDDIVRGYSSLDSFCKFAPDEEFNTRYAAFRQSLRDRGYETPRRKDNKDVGCSK